MESNFGIFHIKEEIAFPVLMSFICLGARECYLSYKSTGYLKRSFRPVNELQ
jgi:hypothetical protein